MSIALKQPMDSYQAHESWYAATADNVSAPDIAIISSQRPTFLVPAGVRWEGWEIVSGLFLELEQEDTGDFIISDERCSVYGNGSTIAQAVIDYLQSLAEYYELLEARRDDAPENRAALEQLQALIRPVEA